MLGFISKGMLMESTARLYQCMFCHVQVIICRKCDRGNIYGSVVFLVDLELNASKGYHVGMIYNRRVQYGRTTYTFRHTGLGNNIASC